MDNRTRALAQAVSVDGWIGSFNDEGHAQVHADIVFRQGSFGDNPNSKVRFKIALKRAEIVLRIPNEEPLKVVRKSVERQTKSAAGKKTAKKSKKTDILGKVGIKLGRKPKGSAEVAAGFESTAENNLVIEEEIRYFVEQHFVTPDGNYAWEITTSEAAESAHLSGSPWDAVGKPRMAVKQEQAPPSGSVSMVIEIRCAREDIEIIDLEEKDPEAKRIFRNKANKNINLAAAEQVIKDELFKAGFLEVPDLGEKHSRLLIADKIILVDE